MYKLPGKLKLFSIILMVVGAIGLVYSFMSTPNTVEEAKEIMASQNQDHDEAENTEFVNKIHESGYVEKAMKEAEEADVVQHESPAETALHRMQAEPWSSTFVAAFFFFMIALGVLVFHAVQYASQSGWSPVLYRVFEGITSYLLPGSVIVVLIILLAGTHFYPWQNDELVAHDEILQGKSGYLNFPFFLIRAIIYLLIWNLYRFFARRNSLAQVNASDYAPYKRNFKLSVYFLVFFLFSEAFMAIDWFMSMNPHWYSTLFPWYVFSSIFVSGITAIALITIYLKRLGYLEFVNDSHLHDLGKYIFAFSIFWTYLWFSQFMLIWYANIPEEASYFVMRIQHYNLLFFGMLVLNFAFPILLLMDSDYKRMPWFVGFVGVVLLIGHYIDIYLLIVPSTMGTHGSFGIADVASILFFLGLFILIVGTGLGKVPLRTKADPFIKESENYHY